MKSKTAHSPTILTIGLCMLLANVAVLDYVIIQSMMQNRSVLGDTTAATCPQACITQFKKYVSGTTAKTTNTAKEYYIPLGQGTGSASDWTDVSGVQAYIDSTQYGKIKKITVEITVYVPTGNEKVWVRLVNATDGRRMSPELSMEGTGPTVLTGDSTLDPGNKLYKVQMKTQLSFPAQVTQARVHITTY